VEAAAELVSGYCSRKQDEYRGVDWAIMRYQLEAPEPERVKRASVPRQVRQLPFDLLDLVEFARDEAALDRVLLGAYVPASRKAAPAFLLRVHFARLMVRSMVVLFGQPHYQAVADTINVFFGFAEEDENRVTVDSVRDAWRRNELGQRRPAIEAPR